MKETFSLLAYLDFAIVNKQMIKVALLMLATVGNTIKWFIELHHQLRHLSCKPGPGVKVHFVISYQACADGKKVRLIMTR